MILARDLPGSYDKVARGFQSLLDLYHAVQSLMETPPSAKGEGGSGQQKGIQQVLRPVLRDIAQSILVCYFNSGSEGAQIEHHRKLLAQLICQCNDTQKEDMSQAVRDKAFNRLKVAKEIFRSKLSQRVIE